MEIVLFHNFLYLYPLIKTKSALTQCLKSTKIVDQLFFISSSFLLHVSSISDKKIKYLQYFSLFGKKSKHLRGMDFFFEIFPRAFLHELTHFSIIFVFSCFLVSIIRYPASSESLRPSLKSKNQLFIYFSDITHYSTFSDNVFA